VQHSFQQLCPISPNSDQAFLQLITHRHELVDLGDDAMLLRQGGGGKRYLANAASVRWWKVAPVKSCANEPFSALTRSASTRK
jgi:hypothetical protein